MKDDLKPTVLYGKTFGYKNETLPLNFDADLIFAVKVKPGVKIDRELVSRVNQICPSDFLLATDILLGLTSQSSYENGFGVRLEDNEKGNWRGTAEVPTELKDRVDQICVTDRPIKHREGYWR